jgi:hypothetical protein
MLLRPPTPLTESVALVGYKGDLIHAYLPEKRADFKQAVNNRECFWNWGSRRYERIVDDFAGPASDRAAELGHVLLTAGFCVELADDLGQMILTASYQPEKRRIIGRSANTKYKGWLTIRWPHDEDFWKSAWALPGTRYDKPFVVVPSDQYEAVLDFVERFDFWISPAAQKIIDAAIARKRAALIVEVPPLPTPQRLTPLPAMAPATGEIDPDLADDL